MSTELTVHVNCDTDDQPLGTSGIDWQEMSIANDKLLFSAGSIIVADGETIPSDSAKNQAGTLISATEDVEVNRCFLEDVSSGILREIHNFAENKRYVFAFSFDGETTSEPILELWDDEDLDSIELYSLGNGVADDSWWKGIVTTDGLPGDDWAGYPLAGSENNHFLWLNNENGALLSAKVLYCNLKIIIPAGTTQSGLEQPIISIKYTSV